MWFWFRLVHQLSDKITIQLHFWSYRPVWRFWLYLMILIKCYFCVQFFLWHLDLLNTGWTLVSAGNPFLDLPQISKPADNWISELWPKRAIDATGTLLPLKHLQGGFLSPVEAACSFCGPSECNQETLSVMWVRPCGVNSVGPKCH